MESRQSMMNYLESEKYTEYLKKKFYFYATTVTAILSPYTLKTHSPYRGFMSVFEGGEFGSGFLSGMMSSVIASGVKVYGEIASMFEFYGSSGISDNTIMALQIASSGLSGGISSFIAGGTLPVPSVREQGAAIGLTVGLLNHAAHSFDRIIKSRNEIRAVGLDPDEVAPNTESSVSTLLETETLSEMYETAQKPTIKFSKLPPDQGALTTGAIESKVVDYIELNINIKRTFYEMYGHIGHELQHAMDFVTGARLNIYSSLKERGYLVKEARTISSYWSEMRAYNWNMQHTPSLWYNFNYNLYHNKYLLYNTVYK
ncbi:MAG: hypothetical protein Q4G27_05940 [Flavobacteriaceae bacterium]|nr:hypothetical protein [Flavobacteriaceae bacterium]